MRAQVPSFSRLKPFEAAARFESFSLAADYLGLTQTAVSKQISSLEQELGFSLFERRNRAVFLTEQGRRLARVVSSALSEINAEIASLRGERRSGELVLHCQLCEAFYWLMPRLAGFHALHPGVELRVVSSLNPLTDATEIFDVAIQTSGRPSGTAQCAFTASDDVFPVCSPSLIEGKSVPLQPGQLLQFPLIAHNVEPQDWVGWSDWFRAAGCPSPAQPQLVSFDSYPLALQAAVSGYGVALGWRRTTEGMIAEGKLMRPCEQSLERPTELSVFRGGVRDPHSKTDELISWLRDQLLS